MPQLKDKKISIYRVERVMDEDGFATLKYIPIHAGRLWAYVRQLSANEYYAARAVQQTEEMLFTINWRDDVATNCFIEYKGIFYNITRIDTFEGYKDDLKIYTARLSTQPEPGDIVTG